MIERIGPPTVDLQSHVELLKDIDASVLERSSFERNLVTRELGWRAPEGYVFQVRGSFWIYPEGPGMQRGEESLDVLIDQNKEIFNAVLQEHNGDTVKAREVFALAWRGHDTYFGFNPEYLHNQEDLLQDEWGDDGFVPPDTYEGKWIVISPNLDGTVSEFSELDDTPLLKIKRDVEQFSSWTPKRIMVDAQESVHTALAYNYDEYEYKFCQEYAIGDPGRFEVTLAEDKDTDLYIPPPLPEQGLLIPKRVTEPGAGLSSVDYGENQILKGRPWNNDLRVEVMRYYRNMVVAFSDDLYTPELVRNLVPYLPIDNPLSSREALKSQMHKVAEAASLKERNWERRNARTKTPAEQYGETVIFYPSKKIDTNTSFVDAGIILTSGPSLRL